MSERNTKGLEERMAYLARQCTDVADQLLQRRRNKYLRKKGRKETKRSHRQYVRGKWRDKIFRVLQDALSRAKSINQVSKLTGASSLDDRIQVYESALLLLQGEVGREIQENRGRKKRVQLVRSLMSKSSSRRGRPKIITPEEEQRWVNAFWGVATAMWAEIEGYAPETPMEAVVANLTSQPDWQKEVEKLIPKAIRSHVMQEINPPAKSINSLIQRARIAREIYSLPQGLKSGG